MKKALGKKELLVIVPLSMSSIDRLEHKGQFPKRFYITDGAVPGMVMRSNSGSTNVRPITPKNLVAQSLTSQRENIGQ